MAALLDIFEAFFIAEDWDYQRIERREILRLGFTGDHGNWTCFAQSREDQRQVVFYSICPLRVPEAKRAALAEYLTRANYGLIVGNFELDYDDGEIRFKTSLDVEDAELTSALLSHIVYANVTNMDRYLPGIVAVLAGSQTPLEAVSSIDAARAPDLTKS
jgi:hypothetical protein